MLKLPSFFINFFINIKEFKDLQHSLEIKILFSPKKFTIYIGKTFPVMKSKRTTSESTLNNISY